jgi:hypothetical protein
MHFLLSTVVLQTAILCTAVSNFGQRPFSDDSRAKILNTRVNAAISSILKEFKTPGGVGVAVVQKSQDSGWRIETRGYGLAKVDGTMVTDDTLFAIGSNSKVGIFPLLSANSSLIYRTAVRCSGHWAPDLQRNPVASNLLEHQNRFRHAGMGIDGPRSVI